MGRFKIPGSPTGRTFDIIRTYTSTAAIIVNRVVKIGTAATAVKHTTGTSGRVVLGVALGSATGAGRGVPIGVFGVFDIEASSRAVAAGAMVRASSGAASTASRLGGTVRSSTNAMTTALPVRHNLVGLALTSAAAGTGKRLISVFVNPTANNPALL